MYREEQFEKPKVAKYHHIIYISASAIIFILIIVDLALNRWFSYCWWDFGLIYAGTFTDFENLQNENSISDVKSDACGSLKGLIEGSCPDFCDYIDDFQSAGAVMVFSGIATLISIAACIFFHFLAFNRSAFRFRVMWVFLIMPTFWYSLGYVIYLGVGKFGDIKSTSSQRFKSENFEMKEGMILAIVVISLNVMLMAYSFIKTKRAFLS
ncbi:unnamed protein product [Blepharisma stoltei]|uniref:Uncharacterized protein n=1 Tax=Blepharisma stoltei TaxID=1481888 RepID=A0AAU9IAL6_9CILI|nr:unnamed protein product [Blepharisma stoltei]